MRKIKDMPDFERVELIGKFIKGKRVLNVGGSEGYMDEYLKSLHKDKKIFSQDLKGKDFNFDLNKSWPIKEKFDTIIAGEVVEHLDNVRMFIEECRSHLNEGGRLILTTPNATGLNYIIKQDWCVHYDSYEGHCHAFTLPMLEKLMNQAGFRVVNKKYVNAFWKRNPLKVVSRLIPRLRPDLFIVGELSGEKDE